MATPIQIVSREMIKPSSPTPHHLRNMKLSYLDQLNSHIYIPIIFFYQPNEVIGLMSSNRLHISQSLKQSLSNILTSFYPLAGTIHDHLSIDCNDTGVEFIEAQAQTFLENAIQQRNHHNLHWYVPSENSKETLLAIKLTSFECGGISIGICLSHKIADFASLMAFVNAWAATCRGETHFVRCKFDLADHFSAKKLPKYSNPSLPKKNVLSAKRYVFNEDALMGLKKEGTSPSVMNPTRVEVVSAFIAKHAFEIAKNNNALGCEEVILLMRHVVNLRTRVKNPHSLENVFGNCIMFSVTLYNNNDSVDALDLYPNLVSKLRSLIRKIDEEYIMKAKTGDCYLRDFHEITSNLAKKELIKRCEFPSWCRYPIYEVNYGWGNPLGRAPLLNMRMVLC